MLLSVDTETTGVNLHHSDRPYLVTICDESMKTTFWEWDVIPSLRHVAANPDDLIEIRDRIDAADRLVFQNGKFDAHALVSVFSEYEETQDWVFPWRKCEDTLLAGHLLESNGLHDLTALALQYTGAVISPFEEILAEACKTARRRARADHAANPYTSKGMWELKGFDATDTVVEKTKGGTNWKADMWLPRAYAKFMLSRPNVVYTQIENELFRKWLTVCSDYANIDSSATMEVWKAQEKILHEKGLWEIYRERMNLPGIAYGMERRGVSLSRTRTRSLRLDYGSRSHESEKKCIEIAASLKFRLEMPKTGVNNSLRRFVFDTLHLPVTKRTKAGAASLDKDAMAAYEAMPDEQLAGYHPRAAEFIRELSDKKACDTSCQYLDSYTRQWVPNSKANPDPQSEWMKIHPSLNITGTDTLRWSCSGFNEQNISKRANFNLRYCFGPAEGREWWSLDAQNIELRIPSYASGEEALIAVFDRPKDPPYFGSYHLVVFDALHPALFAEHGVKCKDLFESTFYQWVKNGNFAMIYGAQEETADRTYRVPGAYRLIQNRFPKIAQLNAKQVALANYQGYVETVPDLDISPRGYPIRCAREYGRISPTVPLNYFVQSTAMWWTARAMVRCQAKLDEWRARTGFDAWITMQVHDEMVFDLPKRANPKEDPKNSNLARVKELKFQMELGGKGIGIPTPVALEYNPETWATGLRV